MVLPQTDTELKTLTKLYAVKSSLVVWSATKIPRRLNLSFVAKFKPSKTQLMPS